MSHSTRGRHAGYGKGRAHLDEASRQLLDAEGIASFAVRVCGEPSEPLSVTPGVQTALARLTRKPGLDKAHVRELFELDVLVAGRLLQAARLEGTRPPRSFRDAWEATGMLLMQRHVGRLSRHCRALAVPQNGPLLARVSLHCAAVAHLSALVARQTPFPSELAWLCGLLHDSGVAAAVTMEQPAEQDDPGALVPVTEPDHDDLSARLIRAWGLPPDIALAVAQHRNPLAAGEANPLAAIVCLGNRLAGSFGYGIARPDADRGALPALDDRNGQTALRSREVLGISEAAWQSVQRDAPRALGSLAARRRGR